MFCYISKPIKQTRDTIWYIYEHYENSLSKDIFTIDNKGLSVNIAPVHILVTHACCNLILFIYFRKFINFFEQICIYLLALDIMKVGYYLNTGVCLINTLIYFTNTCSVVNNRIYCLQAIIYGVIAYMDCFSYDQYYDVVYYHSR